MHHAVVAMRRLLGGCVFVLLVPGVARALIPTPIGTPSVLADFSTTSDVAAAPDGRHVVVGLRNADERYAIQRFDADGNALGAPISVPLPAANRIADDPRVAMAADGSFIVAQALLEPSPITDRDPLLPRNQDRTTITINRYDASGARIGNELIVDAFNAIRSFANDPDIDLSMAPDGRFIIGWRRSSTFAIGTFPLNGGSVTDTLLARRYGADGQPQGAANSFATTTSFLSLALEVAPTLSNPAVALDAGGGYTVAWAFRPAGEITPQRVFAQVFGPAGLPTGLRLTMNQQPLSTALSVATVDLVSLSFGGRLVIWDGCSVGVCSRGITADGRADGLESMSGIGTDAFLGPLVGGRLYPQLAAFPNGLTYAVWRAASRDRSSDYLRQVNGTDAPIPTTVPLRQTPDGFRAAGQARLAVDGSRRLYVLRAATPPNAATVVELLRYQAP